MLKIRAALFNVGIAVKGAHALIELTGAIFVYLVSGTTINALVKSITTHELLEDPNDILANFLLQNTSHFSNSAKDFTALYLFVSAIINTVLVAGLFARKRTMFPIAIVIMTLFVAFQINLYVHTRSQWLILFVVYDSFVIWLIFSEYRRKWFPSENSVRT